jgi:DNA invertase Pin-like site-specific DNA recombinase
MALAYFVLLARMLHRTTSPLRAQKFPEATSFARSVSHLLRSLELFGSLGIGFVSLSEQIDTSTPAGKLVFTVLGAVAELERSLIGERIRAGLRNAKANGKKLGRRPLRVIGAAEREALRKDRRRGLSFQALAQKYRVSVWSAFYMCKKNRQQNGSNEPY